MTAKCSLCTVLIREMISVKYDFCITERFDTKLMYVHADKCAVVFLVFYQEQITLFSIHFLLPSWKNRLYTKIVGGFKMR